MGTGCIVLKEKIIKNKIKAVQEIIDKIGYSILKMTVVGQNWSIGLLLVTGLVDQYGYLNLP